MNKLRALFSLAAFLMAVGMFAQVTPATLSRLGQAYLLPENIDHADSLAEVFADSLWEYMGYKNHFGVPLNEVRNLSVQFPDDQSFALYTWAVPTPSGDFKFHGFLWNPSWSGKKRLVLEDIGPTDAPYRWLKGGQWVGGICYDIITTKTKGKKHYTLLTFRPGRSYHTKYVDAISLGTRAERVHFGDRIFNIRYNGDERYKRRPYRLQFRYSSSLSAAVRWDNRQHGIIADHLAPSKPELVERWFAYGPDFSYDRIHWSGGQWQLEESYPLVRNLETAPVNVKVPTTLGPLR